MNKFQELTRNQALIVRSLKKKVGRDEQGLFIAEGLKVCYELTIKPLYKIEYIIIPGNADIESISLAEKFLSLNIPVYKTQRYDYDKFCDTDTPQDIIAVVKQQEFEPDTNLPFIALDAVSDPGNVGTIIRTAEWFGFNQIILGAGCADIFNPKTIRSSMGSLFRVKCIKTLDLAGFIKSNFPDYTIYGTFLNGEYDVSGLQNNKKIGIIFGNESAGISNSLIPVIHKKVKIPGGAETESLNVSVASGIILYEFFRK